MIKKTGGGERTDTTPQAGTASEERLLTTDEAEAWLGEVIDTFPPELFKHLNGGVVLSPRLMPSPHGQGLYILGHYHYEPYGMGRYIAIYYGSFARLYRHAPLAEQKQVLADVLRHELTHHIESLAGVRDLEAKDERFLEKYKKKDKKTGKKPPI